MKSLTTKRCGLLVVFIVIAGCVIGQPTPAQSTNVECIEQLEMPTYPSLPLQARLQAVQRIRVALANESTPQAIESNLDGDSRTSDLVKEEFAKSATKAIRNSKFSKACSEKTVTLVFHYELRGDENKSPFAFRPPNHFWVRGGPFPVRWTSQ